MNDDVDVKWPKESPLGAALIAIVFLLILVSVGFYRAHHHESLLLSSLTTFSALMAAYYLRDAYRTFRASRHESA